ncbi:MAG TPA: TraB/GumN family protein [Chitinophagales bacterium]|nr:TraB/GumN family protein [Chitinophagales bacterium]
MAIIGYVTSCISLVAQSNSLLWKIESSQLSQPSYLYGTMHSRDRRAHEFGDSVLPKLTECEAVALEILPGEMMQNPLAMLGYITMKDTTLDMLLSEADYRLVKNFAAENLGMYGLLVDRLMPIFTSGLITELMMGNDMEATVDEFFEQTAIENGKKTIGIETVEEQLSALSKISLKEQAEMLAEQLRTMDEDSVTFEKMMECYRMQNLPCLQEIYASEEVSEAFDKSLIASRNRVMALRIDSIIRQQPTFVAVGALHLAGENGLIELLKGKGFAVIPVFSAFSGKKE